MTRQQNSLQHFKLSSQTNERTNKQTNIQTNNNLIIK
jgi:hypothetical protein